MVWSPEKKYKPTLLVYPSTDVPSYISKGEKSEFSDLKGKGVQCKGALFSQKKA